MERIVIVLLSAHLIADFLLQPRWLILRKQRYAILLLHALIHASLAYFFLQAWSCWPLLIYILSLHTLIDFGKRFLPDTTWAFVGDQLAHYASIAVLAAGLLHFGCISSFQGRGYALMVLTAGFAATVKAAGFLLGKVMKKIRHDNGMEEAGLKNGGSWTGQLERGLVFIFFFSPIPSGIAFLLAAKLVFLFRESKTRETAEYMLIGTLLSFSLGLVLALATGWALGLN